MRVKIVDRAPCELEPGELRRVPQNLRVRVVGYHVCCPGCGFVTMAVDGDEGLAITEGEGPDDLSFSRPVECLYCEVLVRLDHGEIDTREGGDVRRLSAR